MRLDKLLSHMGYGSRKEVKELLKKSHVMVNQKKVRNGNVHVDPETDEVLVQGELVQYREFIYLMLHKPPGYISATVDEREKTVIDLLADEWKIFSPFPVGRLDKDTEGLLLMTNDGKLAHQLLSPKKEIDKTYYAKVKGEMTTADIDAFQAGVLLDDGYKTKPATLEILTSQNGLTEVQIVITEGKFHQVKRMVRAVGKEVVYLKRLQMGELVLDPELPMGAYRELTEDELSYCLSR